MSGRVETIGPCTLILGDALDALQDMPEESIDAIITDPPYCSGSVSESKRTSSPGQGLRSENLRRFGWFVGDNMGTAGLMFLLRSVASAGRTVVKTSGSMIAFCDWRMLPNLAPAIESAGWRYQNLIVWDKGSMGLGTGFRAQHELAMHFTAGSPQYHDQGTGNVIRESRVESEDREHQAQKPVGLMKRLCRVACPEFGKVLDPFMGSGSTALACIKTRREFIGVERDVSCFEIAVNRIRKAWAEENAELYRETL